MLVDGELVKEDVELRAQPHRLTHALHVVKDAVVVDDGVAGGGRCKS